MTRYRIVCADGRVIHRATFDVWVDAMERLSVVNRLACGPHTVEPVEPVAPDPTCAQSSCAKCQSGKPDKCAARPYYTPDGTG